MLEVELPKVVRKKMDMFVNVEDDYAIIDELLKVGEETQKLSVNPITLAVQQTDKVINLEMPEDSYALTEQTEELPLGEVLRARKARAAAISRSGVTTTGKRVAGDVPLEGTRGKRSKNVNIMG